MKHLKTVPSGDPRFEYLLIELPQPLAALRSVNSEFPPFIHLLFALERAVGAELGYPDVAVDPATFAALRMETARWIEARHRLGLDADLEVPDGVDALSVEGFTAPRVNRKLRAGQALAARRVGVIA